LGVVAVFRNDAGDDAEDVRAVDTVWRAGVELTRVDAVDERAVEGADVTEGFAREVDVVRRDSGGDDAETRGVVEIADDVEVRADVGGSVESVSLCARRSSLRRFVTIRVAWGAAEDVNVATSFFKCCSCVCVCACARVCVCVCVRARARVRSRHRVS
jgi:hypothetical protein